MAAVSAYWGFGVPRSDYVVQMVAVLAMALVGGAVLVVLLGAYLTHRGLNALSSERSPVLFEARRGFATVLRIPARGWLPFLEVTWTWEQPEDFDVEIVKVEGEILENIESHARAKARRILRRFLIEDSFGLARVVMRKAENRSVRVLPWTGGLERSAMLRSLAQGDELPHPSGAPVGDRVDMRRYVPGDPLRLALWKVYARTRQLMVRTPERAIAPSVRVVAYLVATEGDEPAAAAAKVAIQGGLLGDEWVFGADGEEGFTSDPEEALEMIVDSKSARGTPRGDAAGLERFIQSASQMEPTRIVVFAPGMDGPWLQTAVEVLKGHPGRSSCLLVTDGARMAQPPKRLERWLKFEDPKAKETSQYTTPDQITRVANTLRHAGVDTGAVERPTGRTLGLGGRSDVARYDLQGAA